MPVYRRAPETDYTLLRRRPCASKRLSNRVDWQSPDETYDLDLYAYKHQDVTSAHHSYQSLRRRLLELVAHLAGGCGEDPAVRSKTANEERLGPRKAALAVAKGGHEYRWGVVTMFTHLAMTPSGLECSNKALFDLQCSTLSSGFLYSMARDIEVVLHKERNDLVGHYLLLIFHISNCTVLQNYIVPQQSHSQRDSYEYAR